MFPLDCLFCPDAIADWDVMALDVPYGSDGLDWFFYLASGPFKNKPKDKDGNEVATSL